MNCQSKSRFHSFGFFHWASNCGDGLVFCLLSLLLRTVKRSRTRENNVFQPLLEENRLWKNKYSNLTYFRTLIINRGSMTLRNFPFSSLYFFARLLDFQNELQFSIIKFLTLLILLIAVRRTRKHGLSEEDRKYLLTLAAQVAAAWIDASLLVANFFCTFFYFCKRHLLFARHQHFSYEKTIGTLLL